MNKVFITGASGFVGKNLLQYLQARQVDAVPFSRSRGNDYALIDEAYLDDHKIGTIVHLAGKAHDVRKVVNGEEYYQANTVLTQQLFDAFLASNSAVFIYMSSVKASADKTSEALTEDMMSLPLTDYGKSKLAAEEYLLKHSLPSGKRLYILRPCMIHGPGNKGNLNLLYQVVQKGIPYPLAGFNNERSFLSVENLCFVIEQFIKRREIPSGIYHIADDEPISTKTLVQIIAGSLGKKAKLWNVSPAFIRWVAKLGDIIPLPLNSERLQKLADSYVVSNRKLISALQLPLPITSIEGLKTTIESFKDAS